MRNSFHLIIAALMPLLSTPSWGQTQDEALFQMSLKELLAMEVTSASRATESVLLAPATLRVVNRQQIQQRGYNTLAEVLQNTAGFDQQWASDSADFNRVGVRGIFGNNKLLILQDGIRISPATGDVLSIAENYPLHGLKRIEILLGPASALYGADALTSVVNLITLDQDINEVSAAAAGYDERRVNLATHNTFGNWRLRFSAHHQQSDYSELAQQYSADYALNDLVNFSGTTVIPASARSGPSFDNGSDSIDLGLSYGDHWQLGYNQRRFRYSTATASRADFVDYGQDPQWESSSSTAYIRFQSPLTENLKTDTQLNYNQYHLDNISSFANIFVGFERNYKYARSQQTELTQLFTYTPEARRRFTAGYTLQWLYALPLTADLPSPYQTAKSAQQQALYFPGTDDSLEIPIYEVNWRNNGLFGQWQERWTDQLSTTLGVRFDESSTYGKSTTPRLGVVYQLNDANTFKASYAEAYLAPSPQASYRIFGSFAFKRTDDLYQSFFFQLPNSALEPETLKTTELSWTYLANDALLIETSVYKNQLKNAIQAVNTEPPLADFIPGGVIATTQINDNIATLDSYGLDATVNYQGQYHTAWMNYSYVNGTRTTQSAETALPFTSHHKIQMGLTLHWQQWSVTPSARWNSATSLSEVGPAMGKSAASFAVVDLNLQRANVLPGVELTLAINNLFDRAYGVAGEGSNTVFIEVPQRRRWLSLGVRWQWH